MTETVNLEEEMPREEQLDVEVTPYEPSPQVLAMIAEAEERGYRRGRNEAIAERMRAPGLLQNPVRTAAGNMGGSDSANDDKGYESLFLSGLRPGVWD